MIIYEKMLMKFISGTKMLFSNKKMTDRWITTLLNKYDIRKYGIY